MAVEQLKSLNASGLNIKKVFFSKTTKKLTLILAGGGDPQAIEKLRQDLASKLGEDILVLVENNSIGALEEIITTKWRSLVMQVTEIAPAMKPFLLTAKKTIVKENIKLGISNQWGLELLLHNKCTERLKQKVKEIYEIDVFFEVYQLQDVELDMKTFHAEAIKKLQVPSHESKPQAKTTTESNIICGRAIAKESRYIKDVIEEEKNVIITGELFGFELMELKSGRKLLTFDVTDYTDSLSCKMFLDDKNQYIAEKLSNGQWLKLRGLVQHDKFSQELTMFPTDIVVINPTQREDNAEVKRIEFHLHTKMSSLDSVADIKSIMKTAQAFGHEAVAITDHGVVQAFPEAFETGKKLGVKTIFGVEGYLIADETVPKEKQKTFHIIILAKNLEGLHNLYRLITLSHLQYYYRRPRIPRSELVKYREGLIIGSACEAGELYQGILKGKTKDELKEVASFYDYLEIQPLGNNQFMLNKGIVNDPEDLKNHNRMIYKLGKELGKPVIATCDVHFIKPEDSVYRQILMTGKGFDDTTQAPLHYRTTTEMLQEFMYLGEDIANEVVIENTRALNDQIEVFKPIPDELYPPEIEGAEDQIINMTNACAHEMYGDILPEVVQKRLDKELNSIIKHGFAVLYLIAHKLVKKSNDDGYLVGSRGSVGSSFVATMTGITEVNPLPPHYLCLNCKNSEFILDGSIGSGADLPEKTCPKCNNAFLREGHDIPFEVFLGFEGDKVPDIDLNFSGDYQPRAHKYVEELFGKDNVFRAGTIATIAEKTAFGFVKNYLDENKYVARGAEIKRLSKGCTGVKRTTGQHPGGMMVVPKNLDVHQFTPLQKPADDTSTEVITTHFDYHSISSRLVKLDILGHDDPTVIKMLEDLTGIKAQSIPLGEPTTMEIFSDVKALNVTTQQIRSTVGTYGIPEFGTKFVRQMLEDTKPKTFSELVRISGFSHGTDVWLNNAQDLIKSGTAKLSEAISTRDDIMVYLLYKGLPPKVAFKIMEDVRKGKGVKPEYEQEMKNNNVPNWYIESCKKIKYMFPKAHAVAYVTMAFRIAYFKVFYPKAFYATYFSVRADEFDADLICRGENAVIAALENVERKGNEASQKEKNLASILELALEMYCRNIKLLKVDLEKSEAKNFLLTEEGILPPFAALQGVGESAAVNIVNARKETAFKSIEDMKIRAKIGKNVIEALSNHGCLRDLPETSQLTIF